MKNPAESISLSIRRCRLDELDSIMELQQHISDTMTNPDLFVSTDRSDNRDYLISPNAIFCVYDGERLAAYGSIIFSNDAPEHLGWDLAWNRE